MVATIDLIPIASSDDVIGIRTTEWQKEWYFVLQKQCKFGVWKQHMFTYQVCHCSCKVSVCLFCLYVCLSQGDGGTGPTR